MAFTPIQLQTRLAGFPEVGSYLVAYSGGGDSTALLHALKTLDLPSRALHVNHQLHTDSDQWAAHCEVVCRQWDIPLDVVDVQVGDSAGQGLEAVARTARYEVLRQNLQADELLLTAHHQDDQAETVLLQLMRGAGAAGLAGMRPLRPFGAGWHGRPLLDVPQADLLDYSRGAGLDWLEDPANRDEHHKRNFLRHQVIPLLESRWPAAKALLARSADNLRDVVDVLNEVVMEDLPASAEPLSLEMLQNRSDAGQRLWLRHWLEQSCLRVPQRSVLEQIQRQTRAPRQDAEVCVAWPGAEVRVYRGHLYALKPDSHPAPNFECFWDGKRPLELPAGLGRLALTSSGETQQGAGLGLSVRFRRGGERIRLAGNEHHTELKALFQDMGIPPWERGRVPLVFHQGELAAVGDWRMAEGFSRAMEERGLTLGWDHLRTQPAMA